MWILMCRSRSKIRKRKRTDYHSRRKSKIRTAAQKIKVKHEGAQYHQYSGDIKMACGRRNKKITELIEKRNSKTSEDLCSAQRKIK